MKVLLLTCALVNYFSFFYSTIRVFASHPEKKERHLQLLKLNTIALWVMGTVVIWSATPQWHHSIVVAVQVLCSIGFWSTSHIAKRNRFTAIFSEDTPVTLVRHGLYKYVRHPFYCIYLCCYGSIAFVEFSPIYVALFVGISYTYVVAARAEESKFRASGLSGEHEKYATETGMFFPKLRRRSSERYPVL